MFYQSRFGKTGNSLNLLGAFANAYGMAPPTLNLVNTVTTKAESLALL
ncbi:MAG: hypothetical protein ACFB0G_06735 [Leptolyngbyaceae cyanobacterium]